jgi:putative membrane protein (TIGR04086 family)
LIKTRSRIKDYLAGACLANAPILIVFLIISLFYEDINSFHFQFFGVVIPLSSSAFILMVISVIVAGFIVAAKVSDQYVLTGLFTGGFAFLLYFVNRMIFFPSSVTAGISSLVSCLLAGSFGGLLRKLQITKIFWK